MFCRKCGAEMKDRAVMCVKCGALVESAEASSLVGRSAEISKEWPMALVLCGFLGIFGAHRFYTGNTGSAIAQLVLGLCSCFIISGIWALVDFICLLSGSYKTGDGRLLTYN